MTIHTILFQILQGKLDEVGRSKGNLVERLHRTREENDDLRFQVIFFNKCKILSKKEKKLTKKIIICSWKKKQLN